MIKAKQRAMSVDDFLDAEDMDAPLHVLRYTCVECISFYLNMPVERKRGKRYTPNYGGLGELIGFVGLEIVEMGRRENPGLEILKRWHTQSVLKPSVGNLVRYLLELGREDILTDTIDMIRDDIKFHREKQNKNLFASSLTSSWPFDPKDDPDEILTIDDVIEGRTIYDAFVCYDGKDEGFVRNLVSHLEHPRFGFRFFVRNRNNLTTAYNFDTIMRIMSERCRHIIVVFSDNFMKSQKCEFQAACAFARNPAHATKMIPIRIQPCPIPRFFNEMAPCDFCGANQDWSWQRLTLSLLNPMIENREFLGTVGFSPPQGSDFAILHLGIPVKYWIQQSIIVFQRLFIWCLGIFHFTNPTAFVGVKKVKH